MTTTTAKKAAPKPTARKRATKPAPKATVRKATASKDSPAKFAPKEKVSKTEPTSLIEALTTKQAVLIKVRGNGTRRSLPYYAKGSEYRATAEKAAAMKAEGRTVEVIAESLKVSLPTARRFLTGLELAQQVEVGKYDAAWKPGSKEVVVHTVNPAKA